MPDADAEADTGSRVRNLLERTLCDDATKAKRSLCGYGALKPLSYYLLLLTLTISPSLLCQCQWQVLAGLVCVRETECKQEIKQA